MKNDFISIYSDLDNKEQKGFGDYIQCFYSNQKSVLSVFEEVVSANAEKSFDVIKQASIGNKNRLNAFADLKKWLFEFLALQEIRQSSTESKFLSLEALRKRGLFDAFHQKSKQLALELEKQQNPNLWHLFWKVRLSHINYFHIPLDRLQEHQSEMSLLMQDLDNFYFSAKLQYSAEVNSRSAIRQEDYHILLLEDILSLIDNGTPITPIAKELYLLMYDLTKHKSKDAYSRLKRFLVDNPNHDALERQAILLYLINAVVANNLQGKTSAVEECFELYQFGLQHSLFTVSSYFTSNAFANIINVGSYLKQYDWLNGFVKQWSPYLPPTEKDEIVNFALARIYFEERKFDQVITLLQKVEFKNFNITLNTRTLLLRAYYEQNEEPDFILDACNAFYLYVYRSKSIGNELKENAINFVKIFRALISKKSKNSLVKELNKKEKKVLCHDWLKAKIEALSN